MAAEVEGRAFLFAIPRLLIDDGLASQDMVHLFKGKESIVKLLEELKTTLNSAAQLVNDAEKKLIKDQRVKKWLVELNIAAYDADDLVYRIKTEALRKEQEGISRRSITFTSKVLKKLNPTSLSAFDRAIKPEIEKILGKMKPLLDQKNDLGLEIVETKLSERSRTPLVEKSDVFGRDKVKEDIIKLLLSDATGANKIISVIPIVGIGGIGKTTLARLVYNDERVSERFSTKAWVMVGGDKLDCSKVMRVIIEKVTSEKCEIEDPHVLQDELKKALSTKKFLFVLDDVRDDDSHAWNVLRSSFESGLHGSKIIVTTRGRTVAAAMKAGSIHLLKDLSRDDGWKLLANYCSINEGSNEYSDLRETGKELVKKCNGIPSSIKLLGSFLRGKQNKGEWDSINNDVWELYEKSGKGFHPSLWLSYHYLPSHLKPCFAYCALFPKDDKFEKEKIILLWMAEGLLHSEENKTMEEVGEEYFEDLISRSFFQPSSEDQLAFVIDNLLHELAIFLYGKFYFWMDDTNLSDHAKKIRHLSYSKGCHELRKFEGLSKIKGLRTFLALPLSSSCRIHSSNKKQFSMLVEYLLRSLLSTGKYLRVLSLSQHYISKLPDSIGDLKNLRYLDLSYTEIEEIPEKVCSLYNLQTLLLEGCTRLTILPKDIGNLINLRHLYTPPFLRETPRIGNMKNLRTLSEFHIVGKDTDSGIKMLKELQHLHGTLHISGLENVDKDDDVSEGYLEDKQFLSALILKWGFSHAADDSQKEKEKEVLALLKPHLKVKQLDIHNYQGIRFPDWFGQHSYENVVTVRLFGCKSCSLLPPLGQLPCLKHLMIQGLHSVVKINPEFYSSAEGKKPFESLETLLVKEMPDLEEGLCIEGKVEAGVFSKLKELELRGCPKLQVSLPDNLPTLRKLVIYECNLLKPLFQVDQPIDAAFPCLETISISECNGQESLLKGGLPSSLKKIVIFCCENLTTLDEVAFQQLISLEKLEISFCVSLERLPKQLPASLSYLLINNCPSLTPRLQKETGEDWAIIKSIQTLDIWSRGLQRSLLRLSDANPTPAVNIPPA